MLYFFSSASEKQKYLNYCAALVRTNIEVMQEKLFQCKIVTYPQTELSAERDSGSLT